MNSMSTLEANDTVLLLAMVRMGSWGKSTMRAAMVSFADKFLKEQSSLRERRAVCVFDFRSNSNYEPCRSVVVL